LGWSMLEGIGREAPTSVSEVLGRRSQAMQELGISRFHRAFNMVALKPLRPYGDIAAEAEASTLAKQVTTVQQLRELRGTLPEDPAYEIPVLPPIETVEAPVRREVQIHKRKTWEGFRRGDRGKFAVEADGFYAIDGGEHAQDANAMGQATVYLANNELRVLKAQALTHTEASGVHGRVFLEVLGTVVADDLKSDALKVTLADPDFQHFEAKPQVTQQIAIGPVPVILVEGATVRMGVGFELGLTGKSLRANLGPHADAQAFVLAGLGMKGLGLVGGAACELTLLELDAGLQGSMDLSVEREIEPVLVGNVNVGLGYGALKGRVFAFADVPMPRWGLPPWAPKRISLDLFNWAGFQGRHRLVNWGMRATPTGVRLLGDLADQTDRDEMAALDALLDAEARARELAKLENSINEREAQVYRDMLKDAGGDSAKRVVRDAAFLQTEHAQIVALREPYLKDLQSLLRDMQQE
jgi:hypothetical protein